MCQKIGRKPEKEEYLVLSASLPGYEPDGSDYREFIGKDGKIYKKCDQCHKVKLYDEFPDNQNSNMSGLTILDKNGNTGGVSKKRKTCNNCRTLHGNKHSTAADAVWKKYNIADPTEKTVCQMCGKTYEENKNVKMVRDHCHKTHTPRGYLCNECNTGVGKLGDDLEIILERITKYYESVKGENWKQKFYIQENILI